eukprot:CAMPEP_0182438520 /NCGR_PEP_ID=MMETSP1167-20130531/85830_1 /TAXON_ID=2988 /ORGANISM="Mallomonas Sp, Strain CCMP3275" /LENGTH=576 /DNA_ID=CAMNT_0024631927 /DNA_START=689 /DNA_END=2416 /DNA_ORIENTATION=-
MSDLPGGADTRVGIFTFDTRIQFYVIRRYVTDPLKIMVVDSDDPVAPMPPKDWIFPLVTHQDLLDDTLTRIPELMTELQQTNDKHTYERACPIAAILVAQQALESVGGRVVILTTTRPNYGYGKMKNREGTSLYGGENEICLYGSYERMMLETKSAEEKENLSKYRALSDACLKSNVCVDIFISLEVDEFKELGLFAEITGRTGGVLHPITGSMTLEQNVFRLEQELLQCTLGTRASEVLMKLRCSYGIRAGSYIGKGVYKDYEAEVELAGMDKEDTSLWELKFDTSIKDNDKVFIQLAVLYTGLDKKRLIRVHNLVYWASSDNGTVYRYADLDAVTTALFKQAIDKALSIPLSTKREGPRDWLDNSVVELLLKYRTLVSSTSPRGQLILPESMKLIPLYALGMLKHPCLLENAGSSASVPAMRCAVKANERVCCLHRCRSLPIRETINCIYPRLFALHSLDSEDGYPEEIAGESRIKIPRATAPTSELLDSDGVYLLDDGLSFWLFIGRLVSNEVIAEWFGINPTDRPYTISFITPSPTAAAVTNSAAMQCSRIIAIIDELRDSTIQKPEIRVIW